MSNPLERVWFAADLSRTAHAQILVTGEMGVREIDHLIKYCLLWKSFAQHGGNPEATCERCGRNNIVWFAPSELWNKYSSGHDILCPVCFAELAELAGLTPTAWQLAPESFAAKSADSDLSAGDDGQMEADEETTNAN